MIPSTDTREIGVGTSLDLDSWQEQEAEWKAKHLDIVRSKWEIFIAFLHINQAHQNE